MSAEQTQRLLEFGEEQLRKSYNWRGVRRLARSIILGSNPHWRPRIAIDLAVLGAAVGLVCGVNALVLKIILTLAYTYSVILLTNLWWVYGRSYQPEGRDVTPELVWIRLGERVAS
jgi:hypothetical protein